MTNRRLGGKSPSRRARNRRDQRRPARPAFRNWISTIAEAEGGLKMDRPRSAKKSDDSPLFWRGSAFALANLHVRSKSASTCARNRRVYRRSERPPFRGLLATTSAATRAAKMGCPRSAKKRRSPIPLHFERVPPLSWPIVVWEASEPRARIVAVFFRISGELMGFSEFQMFRIAGGMWGRCS